MTMWNIALDRLVSFPGAGAPFWRAGDGRVETLDFAGAFGACCRSGLALGSTLGLALI
jgi:hypothetical protein